MPSLTKVQTGFLEAVNPFTLASGTASAPIISFSDSAATGIFSPSTGVLGFSTGSTQNALRILSDGKVGIGTTNPSLRLDVQTTSSADVAIFKGNTAGTLLTIDNNTLDDYKIGGVNTVAPLVVYNNTDARYEMVFDGSGNLGIGTTAPLYNTHIYGSVNGIVSLVVANKLTDVSSRAFFALENDTGGQGSLHFTGSTFNNTGYARPSCLALYTSSANTSGGIAIAARNSSGYIDFYTGGGTQRAIIDSAGNVGIGTTNPGTKLDVYGDIAVNGTFAIRRNNYGYSATYKNVFIGSTDSVSNTVSLCVDTSTISGGNFHGQNQVIIPRQGLLVPNQAGTNFIGVLSRDSNDYIRIGPDTPGGISGGPITVTTSNVGIGTNQPLTKFFVKEGSSSMGFAEYNGGATIWLDGADGDISGGDYFNISANNSQQLAFGYAGGTSIVMSSTGNVGIGTTNPLHKLDIRGDTQTYGLRLLTDLTNQTESSNIAVSASNLSYKRYGGVQSYVASITCNNTWYTLIPNFNDTSGYMFVTAGDASSKNVQEYVFMTTSTAYGIAFITQLHNHGSWNTGTFELQLGTSGGNYTLQARATSYYSSSSISGIYIKIISNY